MAPLLDEFAALIEKYIELFGEMKDLEQSKMSVVRSYNVEQLDICMKQEQVFILRMKGYDQNRISIQKKLSFQDLSFKDMLPLLPEENRESFEELFNRLNKAYVEFQKVYDCAKESLEINSYRISTALENYTRQTSGKRYSPDGAIEQSPSHSIKNVKV